MMRNETVAKYTRQNTGRHMLDSGGASGRHWQQPTPAIDSDLLSLDEGHGATVCLHALLREHFEQNKTLTMGYGRYRNTPTGGHFEATPAFMESRGYVQVARDNVYNYAHGVDQVYVWEVYQREENVGSDWPYDSDAVLVMYIHTGADVRGGYSAPIFGQWDRYDLPVYPVRGIASYYPEDPEDDAWEYQTNFDRWDAGYSGYPWGEVESDLGPCLGVEDGVFIFEGGKRVVAHYDIEYAV